MNYKDDDFETSVVVANITNNLSVELEKHNIPKDATILLKAPDFMLSAIFSSILIEQMEVVFGKDRKFILLHNDVNFERMTTEELMQIHDDISKILKRNI